MYLSFRNGKESFRVPQGDSEFNMVVTGDCFPGKSALEEIRSGRGDEILKSVMPFISSADLKIVQLETPLTEQDSPIDKCGPNLRCHPDTIQLLDGIFDIALLANNHTGDQGSEPVVETIERLQNAGITCVGAGKNVSEASAPLIIDCQGVKIALLNFAENEFGTADSDTPGCAPLDIIENIKAINAAKKKAELVFVVVHGGHERNPMPSPRMIKTYRAFADAGAAMVMNIHTHCPEGIELYNGVPIVYCPGNFYFPWTPPEDRHNTMWWIGYLPKFYCDATGVYAMEILPYYFSNKRIGLFNEHENEAFYEYIAHLNALIADDNEVMKYFEAWVAKYGANLLENLKNRLNSGLTDFAKRSDVVNMLPVRNWVVCESHNDILATYLRLIEQYRLNEALDYFPRVEKLQAPEFAFFKFIQNHPESSH